MNQKQCLSSSSLSYAPARTIASRRGCRYDGRVFGNDDRSPGEVESSQFVGLSPPRWYGRSIWAVTLCSLALISIMGFLSAWWMYGRLGLAGAALGIIVLLLASDDWLMRASVRKWLVGLVALALLLRLACVMLLPYLPCADFKVYHEAGVTMAKTWTLGDQADAGQNGSYRCFFPPGQVFSLGVMYRLFGHRVLAAQILNVIYSTLTVVGIWYLGRKMFSERAGRIAAVLVAFLPSTIFGCMLLGAEVPEAFWLVLAMCFYVKAVESDHRLVPALLCGICLGVGTLIRPTYFLLPVPIGLHMLLSWGRARRAILSAAVMSAGLAAVVLPWTYRNYRVTGGFILVSSNAGGVLYSANNDNAQGAYTQEAWEYVSRNSPDDLALMRVGRQCAINWIKANPGRFFRLALKKFVLFWHTDKEIAWWAVQQTHEVHPKLGIPAKWRLQAQAGSTGYYVIIILAGALGVWRWGRQLQKNRAWMFIPVMCMYFTAVHMVFESQGKYHYMLIPLLCILAAGAFIKRRKPATE